MEQFMTMAQILARFDSEWVLIGDPDLAENLEVQGGRVLWHSTDRDEVGRKALELGPTSSAILYIGEPSADLEFVV